MATFADPPQSNARALVASKTQPSGLWHAFRWDFDTLVIVACSYAVFSRIFTIMSSGGWADRSQFFGDGELRPGIFDFVFNEILIYYLIIRVLIYKPSIYLYSLILLSAFAYYTRVPLILMFFALIVSNSLTLKSKITFGIGTLILSFVVLYLRIGEDLIYNEDASNFYIGYGLIGFGRVWQTTAVPDATALHYLTLFLKPLDGVVFLIDYLGGYGGELSAGRFAGVELSRFEYIQWLQGAYNAFGTVLYPFVLIAGWVVGPLLFCLFLIIQQLTYTFATQDAALSRRYLVFLLLTGTFFSWTSPFAWLAPFMYTRFRKRVTI